MNLGYVFEHGDSVLVSVFLLLTGMSLASWYLIFWKFWKLRREQSFLNQFRKSYATIPDWALNLSAVEGKGCVAALLKDAANYNNNLSDYQASDHRQLLAMHLGQTLDGLRVWLDKGLTVLASVGSSAPFIGLFGTVWGIYGALTEIATQGDASLTVVAGPMGEALVATAVGLFAAIPAVLAYNSFLRLNRLLVQDLRHIAEQLTAYLSLENPPLKKKSTGPVKLVEGVR